MSKSWLRIPECDHKRWSPFLSAVDEKWMPLNVSRGCKGFILQVQAKPIWRQCWGVISPRCKPTSSEPKHNKASSFNKLLGLHNVWVSVWKKFDSSCVSRVWLSSKSDMIWQNWRWRLGRCQKERVGRVFTVLYCTARVGFRMWKKIYWLTFSRITWHDDGHLKARLWW